MDFKNAKELLALCQEKKLPISEVMRQREILLGETTAEIVDQRMDRVLEIMKDACAEMFSERGSPTLWQHLRPTLPWDLSLPLLLPAVPGSFPE